MRNSGHHVGTTMDMGVVMGRADPDRTLHEACARWNAPEPSDAERDEIMRLMDEQVRARFLYDYGASIDLRTGRVEFQVQQEDAEGGGPWRFPSGARGRLRHDDNGVDMDGIAARCEDACVEYIRTSLSYSAAGLEQYDRQS